MLRSVVIRIVGSLLVSTDANKVTASAWRGTATAEAVVVFASMRDGPGGIAPAAVHRGRCERAFSSPGANRARWNPSDRSQ
jgi:hypothetical protein